MRVMLCLVMLLLTACNLTGEPTPENPILTPSPLPATGETELRLMSDVNIFMTAEGAALPAGATVTVVWDDAPEQSLVTFVLSNTLSDGGVSIIGENIPATELGAQATFTVPDLLRGEIVASAVLPEQQEIIAQALPLPVFTEGITAGACRYLPAALGPGEVIYEQPDMNSASVGTAVFDAEYALLDTETGLDDQGGAADFYEIENVGLGQRGWVRVTAGGTLVGDCSAFE